MLDFAIYEGAKTMFGESNLGLGPSVILSLAKSIPPGSCVYHDRYFTTVPLIEEMEKLNLHSTGGDDPPDSSSEVMLRPSGFVYTSLASAMPHFFERHRVFEASTAELLSRLTAEAQSWSRPCTSGVL
ncbi:hypothetical protein EVAR_47263_1 [Eumeta japonica]|uniref:PiggyBac transposable element-derived protein domain-containing protein n=1 Tax=Eumeta variegata TaxID=151549 RepID=A0A4C1XG27_EUMVA|nr:hypothetical protein EVAR_47263_1 [Eumeta japonica]